MVHAGPYNRPCAPLQHNNRPLKSSCNPLCSAFLRALAWPIGRTPPRRRRRMSLGALVCRQRQTRMVNSCRGGFLSRATVASILNGCLTVVRILWCRQVRFGHRVLYFSLACPILGPNCCRTFTGPFLSRTHSLHSVGLQRCNFADMTL